MQSETRTLALHPLAIHTFIKAQAGSLAKALSEAVMNSLDAFATSVDIKLTRTGFVIEDDGHGFQSKDEIAAWFETMGFPHDDGNHRLYGKFGMGRAQMWAFARTIWDSNAFRMNVDVKVKGLNYELTVQPQPFNGTRITAEFYEPMGTPELERVISELQNLVKYVPGLVTLNDKVINKNPDEETWTESSGQAWMRFDKSEHTLSVYNAGLLVQHFPKYRYGCGGVVVTKPPVTLSLNLARNEILEAECPVWKELVKKFPKKEADYNKPVEKKRKLSGSQRNALVRSLTAGVKTLDDVLGEAPEILSSVTGRAVQRSKIASGWRCPTVLLVPKGDEFGKLISKLKLAVVLSDETLQNFDVKTPDELKAVFLNAMPTGTQWEVQQRERLQMALWTSDAKGTFPDLASGKKEIPTADLMPAQKAALSAWSRSLYMSIRGIRKLPDSGVKPGFYASVSLGDSAVENLWLDEATDRLVLRANPATEALTKPMPVMTQFAMARIKDLCHVMAEDPEQGDALFVRVVTETEVVGELVLNLSRHYIREANARDLAVPRTRLDELEALSVE